MADPYSKKILQTMHINTGKMKINRKSGNNSQAKTILKTKFRISTEKKIRQRAKKFPEKIT